MIDPFNIRRPESVEEAQELLVFCVCVANATSTTIAPRVEKLLNGPGHVRGWPLEHLSLVDRTVGLEKALRDVGIGCQTMKAKHLRALWSTPYVRLFRLNVLEKLVGPKTARMFLLFVYPDRMDIAVLDRHQLAWLRENGLPGAPLSTPPRGWPYKKWEMAYIEACRRRNLSVRHLDMQVWNERARRTRGANEEAAG